MLCTLSFREEPCNFGRSFPYEDIGQFNGWIVVAILGPPVRLEDSTVGVPVELNCILNSVFAL